jgi:hypothetical protein
MRRGRPPATVTRRRVPPVLHTNDQVQGEATAEAPNPLHNLSSNPNFIRQRSPMGWPVQAGAPQIFSFAGPPWGDLGLSIADPAASCAT